MKKALILEDLPDAQKWLHQVVDGLFDDVIIEVVGSISKAEEKLKKFQPDIALIDLKLPDGSGVSILQMLSSKYPECISVVTTIYDDDENLFSALYAGAQGYLLKEQKKSQLIDALKNIEEGKPALSPQIATKIMQHFSSLAKEKKQVDDKGDIGKLTKREEDVLRALAKGLSSQQVADELFVSYHTVVTHIKNIYTKLNISSRAEATQVAYRSGYMDNLK